MRSSVVCAAVACFLLHASAVSGALTDDLVGLYSFENSFLDTSVLGNANHGTPVNSPGFTPGKIGTAMSLTGVQDYMTLDPNVLTDLTFGDTNLGTDTDFSISMWVRQDDFASDPAVLSNKDWGNGDNTGINWAPKGNGIFDLNTKGTTGSRRDLDTATNSAPLTVGQWNLVVMTVDRDGTTELYINGNNTGTIPFTSAGSFNGGLPWNIGQDGTGSYGVEFTGAVDELAFWQRELTPSEAGELWNGGAGLDLGAGLSEPVMKLVIDRATGGMVVENNTGLPQAIAGYQIESTSGALSTSGWNPVAGRLDASGDQSLDADDNWIAVSPPGSVDNLAEISLGSGLLADGESFSLGPAAWGKYYEEGSDIVFTYGDGVSTTPVVGLVEFTGGGNAPFAFEFADLDFDGDLDSDDWVALQAGFGSPLAGQSVAQRYRAGDLNNDGQHSLDDILEFQIAYDAALGGGAFSAMVHGVPEPASVVMAGFAAIVVASASRRRQVSVLLLVLTALSTSNARAARFYAEDFDSVPLGSNVDESQFGSNVWTKTPPAGWTIDDGGMPNGGVTEWRGWSFADPVWWASVDDQLRSDFTRASGAIAVADPDEWDDLPRDPGFFESFLQTPVIGISGAAENTLELRFDSSWRPEDTQTANITVSYDGGASTEVLRFTSVNGDQDFKAQATNESVVVPLNNPAGASTLRLEFGLFDAGNDWWWAIDNIEVVSPLTLEVDVQTGQMQILGDSTIALKGYEVTSPNNSLNPGGWLAGNLDAQDIGNPVSAATDFNNNGVVDGADLAILEASFGVNAGGDGDGDGDTDVADLMRLQRDFGPAGDPASTWLTFLATESQLIESYLFGSSVFAADQTIGAGYDTADDRRDLVFTYTTTDNERFTGQVRYVNVPSAVAAVPEPLAFGIAGFGLACIAASRGRRRCIASD